ncbi:MAG: NUDIX domain-containing protein, partial [Alphaproteobacteria bacterium]|nr:NUDIX domain-containing protein [Alphaproteobacteria bacterium]
IQKEGKYLLGIRQKKEHSKSNGKYFTVGGTLEFLEKIEDCFKREVKEEANIEIQNIKLFKVDEHLFPEKKQAPHAIVFVFTADYKSGILQGDDDCKDPQFFSKEEIAKLNEKGLLADFPKKILTEMGII